MTEKAFDPDAPVTTAEGNLVRDLSVAVYKLRLGPVSTKRMLERDADGGVKLRRRAGAYDPLSKAYLQCRAEYDAASNPGRKA